MLRRNITQIVDIEFNKIIGDQLVVIDVCIGPKMAELRVLEYHVIDYQKKKKIEKITPESPDYEEVNTAHSIAKELKRSKKREIRAELKAMVEKGLITLEVAKYYMKKHFKK